MTMKSPKISARVAALFACQFFGVGLFLPFFPIVLEFRGLSAAEIGFILGAGTIARIPASPILSNLADRTGQRRLSILVYSLIAAAFIGLYSVPGGLVLVAVTVIGYMAINAPVLPLSDAYALDAARNTGADYARMRLWGSAGFVLANLVGGMFAAATSSWIILVLIGAGSLATGVVVMSLPRQQRADTPSFSGGQDAAEAPFRRLWFWPVLAVLGLFQATHSALYGFGSIYWQAMGVSDFAIGNLWAIGVVAEICLFMVAGKLSLRFDPPVFLIVAGLAAVLRWGFFPLADTLPAMVALQLLHGLTFGASHLGAIAILANVVPSRWAGTGQGLLATSIGIQMAIGISISGTLYESDPDAPFYLMAVLSGLGVVIVALLTPLLRKRISAAG